MSPGHDNDADAGDRLRTAEEWKDHARTHYDGLVAEYITSYFDDRTDVPWLDRLLLALPRPATVLDAGCGPGNFARYLTDSGLGCIGIDISQEMVAAARSLVPAAEFRVMDFASLEFPDSSFDGILCAYSLLHAPRERLPDALGEFRRVLKSDGVLALLTKLGEGSHELESPLVSGRTCLVQLLPEADLISLLGAHGFEIVQRDVAPAPANELPFDKIFLLARKA